MKFIIFFFVLLIFFSNLVADLTTGLVAHYPFNGNADDESGNGNHGTVYDAILTNDRFENPNSAYTFGVNRAIQIPNSNSLQIENQITMAGWIKCTSSYYYYESIFCKGHTSSMESPYALLLNNQSIALLLDRTEYYSLSPVPSNQWVHIAITWNGSQIYFFINGEKDASMPIHSSPLSTSTGDFMIAKDPPGVTEWFNGDLDDMYLYNRALSETEIQSLYLLGTILPPNNVEITIATDSVQISWDAASGATSYKIYSSDIPDDDFFNWTLEESGIIGLSWTKLLNNEPKKFYFVKAQN
jgi:hypothetical protein